MADMDPNTCPSTSHHSSLWLHSLCFGSPPQVSSSSSSFPDFQLGIIPQTTALACQVGEKQSLKGERGATSTRIVNGGGEESVEMEGCLKKKEEDEESLHHPCYYFRLAKLAFLRCLGLDFLCSDNTSIT
ncbi:uncharacterized protein LOC120195615 [Hibiscus syriacus]|uniref:uncharacterized protein LOC120195615 n=1 Tax=Hibiscus syriacus TaxID=106335 RepID=UPI001923A1F4|nr:uncharacterized protein LOC120195615 [Hibiscus syriacus]